MESLTAESPRCQKCSYRDDCNDKRLVACAYINPAMATTGLISNVTMTAKNPVTNQITINIKRSITDEIARDFQREIAKTLFCGFNK